MYCTKCGKENPKGAKFCENCGEPMPENFVMPQEAAVEHESEVTDKKRKKNRTYLILACLAVVAVLVSAGIMAVLALSDVRKEKRYDESVEAGLRFLEEEEYEQAAACFDEAISIDPKQVEPYRGAALAYTQIEDYEKVEKIYVAVTEVIVAEYDNGKELPEGSEDIYKDVIIYYGERGDDEKVNKYYDEICQMTTDEEKKAEVEELKQQYGVYKKYYDLLIQYQEAYGSAEKYIVGRYSTYLKGLCMAKLIDFDWDGTEELLLAYADPDSYDPSVSYMLPEYKIEVWKETDSGIEKVYEGGGYRNDGGTTTLYVAGEEGQYYIVEGSADDFETDYIWGFRENRFEKVKELRAESFSDGGPYLLDGNPITEEEFGQEAARLWESCETYGLSRIEEEQDRSLLELEQTFAKLREKLKIEEPEAEENFEAENEQVSSEVTSQTYADIYQPIIRNVYTQYGESNHYSVFDIDKDGVKELLVREGTCEADYAYKVYTIQGQDCVYLGEFNGFHTGLYADESGGEGDYVIKASGHMGFEELSRIYIRNGHVEEEFMSSRELGINDEYYSNPYPLEYRDVTDLSLLQ